MKSTLQYLFAGKSLTTDEAAVLLKDIAAGKHNELQVAAFLSVYNMRFPTTEELIGFRNTMLELAKPVKINSSKTIDIVGTGGDGKDTFNISTLACFVCAGAGVKVTKHGNYSASSVSGASDVLEHIGIKFAHDENKLNEQLEAANITFLHAPLFHPAMKNLANLRKQLQVKTIFNLLGPLINPVQPKKMLIGVHSENIGKLYQAVLSQLNIEFSIVHTIDGYDEVSLTNNAKVFDKKKEKLYTPDELGFGVLKQTDLHGGDTKASNAKIFLDVLNNKSTVAQKNVVLANAALAISLYEENSYPAALSMAKNSLESGKALNVLEKLINLK